MPCIIILSLSITDVSPLVITVVGEPQELKKTARENVIIIFSKLLFTCNLELALTIFHIPTKSLIFF